MKRSSANRVGSASKVLPSSSSSSSSRSKNRQQQQQQPPMLGSPNLDIAQVMSGNFGRGTGSSAEEADEAERLQNIRSIRQKRTKPQDWISMTFHQYRLMNVIGSGTFGEVWGHAVCSTLIVDGMSRGTNYMGFTRRQDRQQQYHRFTELTLVWF